MQIIFLLFTFLTVSFARKSPDHSMLNSTIINDNGVERITLFNSTNFNESSELYEWGKNPEYQPWSSNGVQVIPYFSYGANATSDFAKNTQIDDLDSYSHYIDQKNVSNSVVNWKDKKTIIHLLSTPQTLFIKDWSRFGEILGDELADVATHKISNNEAYVTFGDLTFRFSYTNTGISKLSQERITILKNIFKTFFLVHSEFGSIPGLFIHNFDGSKNDAYISFASSQNSLVNVLVVDEADFATVAQMS